MLGDMEAHEGADGGGNLAAWSAGSVGSGAPGMVIGCARRPSRSGCRWELGQVEEDVDVPWAAARRAVTAKGLSVVDGGEEMLCRAPGAVC